MYLHGGGYVVGSSKSHAKLAAQIGHVAQAQVWLPEYRLAQNTQALLLLKIALLSIKLYLLTDKTLKTCDCGDSAGGGLSLSTVIALRDAGLPLPAALVLLSPWVDLSLSGNTIKLMLLKMQCCQRAG